MGSLPDLLVFSNDTEMIGTFSSNSFSERCNLHLANKNNLGLAKLNIKKYNLIALNIESNHPDEIQYFDQIKVKTEGTPIVVISNFYTDNWKSIFGNKIVKFIPSTIDSQNLCKELMEIILCKVDNDKAKFSGKLDANKLLMLFKLTREINSIEDSGELFYIISLRAMETFGCERASVFMLNKERTELFSRVAIGLERKIIKLPLGKGVVGHVIKTGKPYITNDVKSSPYFNNAFDARTGFETKNIICVPLKSISNETIGAFELMNKMEGEFTDVDRFYLESLCPTIAIVLENNILSRFSKIQKSELKSLREQVVRMEKAAAKESESKSVKDIEDKYNEIIAKSDLAEDLGILRRMLKGNKKADQCIKHLQNYVDDISELIGNVSEKSS